MAYICDEEEEKKKEMEMEQGENAFFPSHSPFTDLIYARTVRTYGWTDRQLVSERVSWPRCNF